MSEALDKLAAENASIAEQITSWQAERSAAGEDPKDWGAFRTHVQSLGAPDPGEEAPSEFTDS